MVKRITITIAQDVLRRIDGLVDGKDIRNRSHAIETLVIKSLSRTDVDTALVLAGGIGARLSGETPKALIPVHGKPMLEHQASMLRKYGIKNLIVSLGHMHEKIRQHFGNSVGGSKVTYVVEEKALGTSGALYAARSWMNDTFVVCNVDTLIDPDIPEILEFHKKQGKLATMLLTTSGRTEKSGVARMRGNSIVEFVEKPAHSESKLVNAGFYIFEPGIKRFLKKKGPLEKVVFPALARTGWLSGYVYDGRVFDVGFSEGYERAIKAWKDVA